MYSQFSQFSSNPYQLLRADTEGSGSQARMGNNRLESRYEKRITTVNLY